MTTLDPILTDENEEFRLELRNEFSRRCRTNPRYSVRSFAVHAKVDSSTMSQILAGKRKLSKKKIAAIAKQLDLRLAPQGPASIQMIDLDHFTVISDWYHLAILDLTFLKGFRGDAAWVARKLSISTVEAQHAIDRLLRLGMLKKEGKTLVKGQPFYSNYSEGMTSASLKEYQRQVITKALQAIDACPQERKDITSMTIAANSRKIAAAKEKIKKFRRELCDFMEEGERDTVFHLAVQLYPVTNLEN